MITRRAIFKTIISLFVVSKIDEPKINSVEYFLNKPAYVPSVGRYWVAGSGKWADTPTSRWATSKK